jgi:LAO/AO transport system kinase
MLTVGRRHDRAYGDRPRPKRPEVLLATATTGEGVPELLAAIDRRAPSARGGDAGDGTLDRSRMARAEAQLAGILGERVRERLHAPAHREALESVLRAIASHEVDPYSAADRLLTLLGPELRISRSRGGSR